MAKTRIDSWAAKLAENEESEWKLFYKAMRCQWQEAAAWAVKEFDLPRMPSRSSFYDWLKIMRSKEHEHRMHEAAIAAAEAAALGKTVTKDEALIAAFKSLATEAALRTDAKTATSFIQSAMAIKDRLQKAEEIDLKEKAQATKDDQLRLAREKFEAAEKRLNAVAEAVKTAKANGGGLTEETLKKIEEAAGLL